MRRKRETARSAGSRRACLQSLNAAAAVRCVFAGAASRPQSGNNSSGQDGARSSKRRFSRARRTGAGNANADIFESSASDDGRSPSACAENASAKTLRDGKDESVPPSVVELIAEDYGTTDARRPHGISGSLFPLGRSHSFVVGTAAAFGNDPVDDLIGIGDVAGLAVDAV